MDIFPPANLPGVGMGNIVAIVGLGGLLGMAATSGMLLAEGALGTLLWSLSAAAMLMVKDPAFGDAPALAGGLLAAAAVLGAVAAYLGRVRSDDPAGASDRGRWMSLLGVLVAGASVGFGWAEWNEVPFTLADAESFIGLGIGVIAAAVGGHAARTFVRGSVRAGGNSIIVGSVTCIAALALNAVSFYVPFAGFVVLIALFVLGIRLSRRSGGKYKGLRILA